ncbi:L,D-transpeptidase [Lutibacter sp.]|uniref:L,D-transpeptidase n=1 Tax=Lutibacter sp. TaxID=1925666 RepID=UPI0035616F0B
MTDIKLLFKTFALIFIFIAFIFFSVEDRSKPIKKTQQKTIQNDTVKKTTTTFTVAKDIQIKNYFQYLDSIINYYNSTTNYNLTEHLLVRFNPWILDTLANTDYYRMQEKDSFVYNQKKLIALKKGAVIIIPDEKSAKNLLNSFNKTHIVINIPEYKLRIYEDSIKLFEFPIRVGRNEKKYLKMAKTVIDLKTKTGEGKIIKHIKNPDYYNPVNNQKYYLTRRDDKKTTKMPQIPWIETEINGVRNGQLIHPTTNPITLNKAYSNGCIGTKEADAWVIYYYAPIGTKITINYQLSIKNNDGSTILLPDIYNYSEKPITP